MPSNSRKAAKTLASFIKPNQLAGADVVIPPHVLKNAKGLAVIHVLKAGFLFSGRAGSGVVVARLPDGLWLPPSAIATLGAGVGGQIGAELTEFVFILNTQLAVDSFAQMGSVTLGTNVSVAAGPLGRNAEAAGTASLKLVLAVFSYSKTKGLFAGVSLEGLGIVERREANRKFYGHNCKAVNILRGEVEAPPECESLMRVLELRVFNYSLPNDDYYDDDYYNDVPSEFSDSTLEYSRRNRRRNKYDDYYLDESDDGRRDARRDRTYDTRYADRRPQGRSRRNTWEDDVYDSRRDRDVDDVGRRLSSTRLNGLSPRRPPALLKPNFGGAPKANATQAIALYTFNAEKDGDLGFKKGDVIDIVKKSDTTDDWWTGRNNGQSGIFPANYVELI